MWYLYIVNGRSEKEFKWAAVESDLWYQLVIVVFVIVDVTAVDSSPNLQFTYAGLQVTAVIHVTKEFRQRVGIWNYKIEKCKKRVVQGYSRDFIFRETWI